MEENKVALEIEDIKPIDFSKMKKKKTKKVKKSKKEDNGDELIDESKITTNELPKPEMIANWVEPYNYEYLLERVNGILSKNNTFARIQ